MTTTTATEIDRYIPVSLATFDPSEAANFPLFIRDNPDTPIHLYRDANYPFEPEDLQRLIDRGVQHLYINLGDHERYQQYLRKNCDAIVNDESLPSSSVGSAASTRSSGTS